MSIATHCKLKSGMWKKTERKQTVKQVCLSSLKWEFIFAKHYGVFLCDVCILEYFWCCSYLIIYYICTNLCVIATYFDLVIVGLLLFPFQYYISWLIIILYYNFVCMFGESTNDGEISWNLYVNIETILITKPYALWEKRQLCSGDRSNYWAVAEPSNLLCSSNILGFEHVTINVFLCLRSFNSDSIINN